ncbi:hypothetical protein KP004_03250 [Geomonas oryzisoli]|uniref:Fibronectin type-III domain-containing protein n=1 Tax=Geomonas oryzisoli TaxID=2847992 RepID=A0ABX8J704_9BACT|nr:hypothetical protein [Geomonas oryzisoli]QWV94223.1 hypothetical protein KP004_03250 [Geomonas oryzisoli]
MIKLKTTFSKNAKQVLDVARKVNTNLNNSPLFQVKTAEFSQDLQRLGEGIDRLQRACDDAQSRDSQKMAYRDKVRDEVVAILKRLVMHVELAANGDVAMLQNSGFEISQEKSSKPRFTHPLPAPVLTVKHGTLSGVLVASAKPVPGAASYEFHITDTDPTVAANYSPFGTFARGTNINIPGRTPGQTYSVIARCIGTAGPGVWSPPFSIISL